MIGNSTTTHSTTTRRQARTAEIVEAAWSLSRANGVAGLSLHALAREVGMRQPSLYSYFESKHALYDAMFADGNRRLLARLDGLRLSTDPRRALKQFFRAFVAFAVEDEARYALLLQRPIPGFAPTTESYELAEEVLARMVSLANAAGVTAPADIDCLVAMVAGVAAAQNSNDPGGNRWVKHLDRLTDMYLDHGLVGKDRR